MFAYLNSIRQGWKFPISQGLTELSTYMSREEFNRKSRNIILKETPDLAYSPFDQPSHQDAYNRYTICRILLMLTRAKIIVGRRLSVKTRGSIIDYKCSVGLLSHELIEVTLILDGQYQVKFPMETLNVLCGAKEAPHALMKIHALMIRESRTQGRTLTPVLSRTLGQRPIRVTRPTTPGGV